MSEWTNPLESDDVIQIVPNHKWGGCIAVVDDPRDWGCVAYVTVPSNDGKTGPAYIRLKNEEFIPLGIKAEFVAP